MLASVFPQLKSIDWKWKRESQESEAMLIWASQFRNLAGGLTSEMFSFGPLKVIRQYLTDLPTHTSLLSS